MRVGDGADTIVFDDPRPQTQIIAPKVRRHTPRNAGKMNFKVREGMLLVFPAWLRHGVTPNQSNRERISISISFNVMFSSFAETISPPRWGDKDKDG